MKDAMFPLLLLFAAGLAEAQQSFPVSELAVDGIRADSDTRTAFRHVAGDWYLFELVH